MGMKPLALLVILIGLAPNAELLMAPIPTYSSLEVPCDRGDCESLDSLLPVDFVPCDTRDWRDLLCEDGMEY